MANTKSGKKRMRQAQSHMVRNRAQRSALRTAIRRVRSATSSKEARAALLQAERLLDRAAGKRLIHPNTAARQKARLHRFIGRKA